MTHAHDARRYAPGSERHRVFSQDDGRRAAAAADAGAARHPPRRSRRGPRRVHRRRPRSASTTARASRTAASRRRCSTRRSAARSNADAGGQAVHDARAEGEPHAAAHTRGGLLRCEARVVHVGGRTATSEGRIVDRNGKLYAHGTTTCIVVEAPRGTFGTVDSRSSQLNCRQRQRPKACTATESSCPIWFATKSRTASPSSPSTTRRSTR